MTRIESRILVSLCRVVLKLIVHNPPEYDRKFVKEAKEIKDFIDNKE